MRPLRGLQESRVATREESGVLGFPSRRGLTRGKGQLPYMEVIARLRESKSPFWAHTERKVRSSQLRRRANLEPWAGQRLHP